MAFVSKGLSNCATLLLLVFAAGCRPTASLPTVQLSADGIAQFFEAQCFRFQSFALGKEIRHGRIAACHSQIDAVDSSHCPDPTATSILFPTEVGAPVKLRYVYGKTEQPHAEDTTCQVSAPSSATSAVVEAAEKVAQGRKLRGPVQSGDTPFNGRGHRSFWVDQNGQAVLGLYVDGTEGPLITRFPQRVAHARP